MSSKTACFITCVSAVSGGGKTAVVKQLTKMVPNSVAIYFDEYDDLTEGANTHPESLRQRILDGADYNAWQMPGLLRDLAKLKQEESIHSVVDGSLLSPQPFIFLDAAFGRANDSLRPLINYMVYIDTPLDIAMARRIQRDCFGPKRRDVEESGAKQALAQIDGMTSSYLDWAREAYLAMDRQVKPLSDLVLDGSLPVAELSQRIVECIKHERSGKTT